MRKFLFIILLFCSSLSAALVSTPPLGISNVTGNGLPDVAMDLNGNALAVWVTQVNNIEASFFNRATLMWSVPVVIGVGSGSPQVGMDQNGNGIIVWNNGQSLQIEAVFFQASTRTFSFPVQVSAGGFNQLPQLAVAPNGNALVVWLTSYPTLVLASEFTGTTRVWSFPIQISIQPAVTAQVSIDRNGNGVAIWDNLISGQIETVLLVRQ